jgi:outer membrane protein, heavy metal efflux system
MIAFHCGLLIALLPLRLVAQQGAADTTSLWDLVEEALDRNPGIEAARAQMTLMGAKVTQEGSLPPPELTLMREGMPSFRYSEAMFSRVEIMQMFPFPTKLASQREIAEINAEHAHHDHMEKEFDVLFRLKSAYAELWYLQQSIALVRRNGELLRQALAVVRSRYGAGGAGEEDVLKAAVESARNDNLVVSLRAEELGAKSMLMGILDRPERDTLGTAVLSDSLVLGLSLDTLIARGMEYRPMLQHDSLSLLEQKALLSAARQEYIPDFRIGIQYMTAPMTGFTGWTVTAGITLPFAPWTLGVRSSRIDESEAGIAKAAASLAGSRAMVRADIRDRFSRAVSDAQQAALYRTTMLPQAEAALRAAFTSYRAGRGDLLMVLDSSRMLRDLTMESLMLRADFARSIAALEQEIGVRDLTYLR